ncbi:MFS transporter [Chryseobacterium koreense]|uniref:Major facilitator transporter n=1 Tax=Chryseobacterium koreense CCUG 49689 TaxID=1304281 RepID=A0A0J7J0L3_9FLAO|nr:MFS transporter [Chryseobacterium koreense]KMQ71586.1 major facilitator transporter [Chryseobacterium koreense CCUG 49689]MBB5333299.1 maltose/moltooligosaccharide transporter [Chryseobacterium koreense]
MSKKVKPDLSLRQIINMSMGFMGIQMAFGLQNGNASRILQNFGADVHHLSLFWLVAPLTGLIVQPIIGHLGDHTWSEKWGRRKPYFLIGALLTAIGLAFLPNSASVSVFLASGVLVFAVLFLAMMDASINVAMEPFRALVGDMLPKHQGTIGFSVQTILIGIGAVIGSNMPAWLTKFGVSNVAAEGFVPDSVIYSFYVGAGILLLTILYTIFTTKEYSPKDFADFSEEEPKDVKPRLSDIFRDFAKIPPLMKSLGVVQFFSWFALFTMWVYTTSSIATHHFGLSPDDAKSEQFNNAGNLVGELFGYYNLFSIGFAFVLIPLAKKIGKKQTHALALFAGGLGLISLYFITDTSLLWIPMIGVGFAWASILAMPYAMLINAIPLKKMGVYMGIFNFFIVLPQIVNGIFGGPIVHSIFENYAIGYVAVGGIAMIIAGLISLTLKGVGKDDDNAVEGALALKQHVIREDN